MLKFASLICVAVGIAAAAEMSAPEITKVNVYLVTNDSANEVEFYRDVIGLKLLGSDTNAKGVRRTMLQVGTGVLEILQPPKEVRNFRDEVEGAAGIRALALFLSDPDQLNPRLTSHGYPEAKFLTPNPGAKVARVKDPDGNFVELIYPDSPTPAKLNHIAVALRMGDVERSKEFYGKTLGLKVIPPHGDPKNPSFGFAIGDSSIFVKHIPNDLPNRGGAPTDATGYRAIMLAVSDVGALEASLKGRDVKIVEPAHGEKVKTLTIADPDGVYLIFVSGS